MQSTQMRMDQMRKDGKVECRRIQIDPSASHHRDRIVLIDRKVNVETTSTDGRSRSMGARHTGHAGRRRLPKRVKGKNQSPQFMRANGVDEDKCTSTDNQQMSHLASSHYRRLDSWRNSNGVFNQVLIDFTLAVDLPRHLINPGARIRLVRLR